ncbi:hypothetical protein FA10DRAFT_286787 [Acaromyces ingoldii]|uniref:Expansin-like EG45 domain-containing protein n=1 Tax=Acaromyces ingoldii TaxID=215250 RepID=A0A316YI82_9BASI|nr:hypothetical protein FA10DRAFT_286787 [Acaromyces ingoldii]PWN88882.1 hypothetical protein FA10DRAFT_286787 [Acaromyces ingoldii]
MRFVIFLLALSSSLARAIASTDSSTELGKRELEPRFGLNEGFDVSLAQRQKHRPSRLHGHKSSLARNPLSQDGMTPIIPQCSPERPCVDHGRNQGQFAYTTAKDNILITKVPAIRHAPAESASIDLNFVDVQTGPITSYGGDPRAQEACHYQDWQPLPHQFMAAIGESRWAGSRGCGTCIHLQGDHQEGYIHVRNRCPECGKGLDLYEETFRALMRGGTSQKRPRKWRFVNCSVIFTGGLVVRLHESLNPWYVPFQIRNSFKPVMAAYFRRVGTEKWLRADMDETYNHFLPNLHGVRIDEMDILIRAFDGEVIVVRGLKLLAKHHYQLAINFSKDSPIDTTFTP